MYKGACDYMKDLYRAILKAVVFLCVCFIVGCNGSETLTDPMGAQAVSKQHYYKLLDSLEESAKASLYDGGIDLNNYYGGAYLDDNKRLIICCTTDDNQLADLFREAAGSSEVVIKSVKFTKDELYSLKEEFSEKLQKYWVDKELDEEEKLLIDGIKSCGVDLVSNHVYIGVRELDKNKEKKILDLFDFFPPGSVEFEEAEIPIHLTGD